MRIIPVQSVVTLCTVLTVTASFATEEFYYSFELDGKPIGFAEVSIDDVTWNEQKLQRHRSSTTLKFAMLGTTKTTIRRSTTLVDPATGAPVYFELTQDINGAVTHVESKFEEECVQSWQWQKGGPKGDPKVIPITRASRILGSNNFAHWNLFTKAASRDAVDGKIGFSVFLPDVGQTQEFRLVRGNAQDVTINGVSRSCDVWSLQGAGIELFVDSQSGQLIKMDVPAQRTTITLADEGVVEATQKGAAQEILTRHFVQSNIAFDDFKKVRMLKAKIDVNVIGSGPANALSVLKTQMQQFDGEKQEAQIIGTVTVRSRAYDAVDTIPFPSENSAPAEMSQWLNPEPLIESDDPAIVSLATELTEGASDRWQAVLRIAQWVNKEIRYAIADSPSARMALERKKGDCGPHSTLTVAMLRAVGIPARLVGGLLYTPSFGGTFGQHAWVEVFLEDDGWIAMDPTTGEHEVLSATHIKLFEGMGGVIPKNIEVVAYEPPNRELALLEPPSLKQLSWKLDQEYTYTYVQNGQKIGTQPFRIARTKVNENDGYSVDSTLDITARGTRVQSQTRLVVQPNAMPISFHRVFEVKGTKVIRKGDFEQDSVHMKITGPVNVDREIKTKPGTYCFDNNLIPSFSMICSQFDLKENTKVEIGTFHPTSMTLIALSFQIKERRKIKVGEKHVECFECFVEPIKNTFWITPDRRLVKVEAPGLVIDLHPVE
jgi:hypothetical protein